MPALLGRHEDFLIVSGLAGSEHDVAAITGDAPHVYLMAGAMGGATAMGLGLALAQPERLVLVVTGDGELLMGLGTLATIAVLNPPNLAILCVDNGHYGETGNQASHTSRGVALDKIAAGAGFSIVRTVTNEADLAAGREALRAHNAAAFVLLRVHDGPAPATKHDLHPDACRARFRAALLAR